MSIIHGNYWERETLEACYAGNVFREILPSAIFSNDYTGNVIETMSHIVCMQLIASHIRGPQLARKIISILQY